MMAGQTRRMSLNGTRPHQRSDLLLKKTGAEEAGVTYTDIRQAFAVGKIVKIPLSGRSTAERPVSRVREAGE